ncbi:hypothetical protein KUTeg_005984 [Tegillarca granosa]|uniref:Ig-like domain-containing protein n=1 Tax=Tegillarca granosa TaxID=220873 RepID=A0ABQ9FI56_TEGGR|nr:hypothetical protein KUTeg_005984 [Tegillarca granosa]
MERLKWIYLLLWISFNSFNCVNTVRASVRSRGLKTGSFPTGYEYLTVYIIDEYNVDKIALLPKETSYVLDAGQNLPEITCTADCGTNSCTYKWKHNTLEFSNGPMLILKNVQKSETGIYECNAQDDLGSTSVIAIYVKVLYGPGPPDPPYQLNVVCLTSTRVMLSWKPGFNRGDEQIFYIQYRSLNEKFRRFPQIIEDDEMNPPTRNSGFSNEYLDLDCSPHTEEVYEEMRDTGIGSFIIRETVYDVPTSEYKVVEK